MGGRAVKQLWKLGTTSHLAVFGARPELGRVRAQLFCKTVMKESIWWGFVFLAASLLVPWRLVVKGRCLHLYLCLRCAPCSAYNGCVPSLETSVLAVRSQAGLSGKGKPSALGRAHLTFASTEFRSPLGGSVGSAAKQSTGCHEQDLSASGREGLGWGSDLWSRGEEETADPPTCKFRGDQLNLMRNAKLCCLRS